MPEGVCLNDIAARGRLTPAMSSRRLLVLAFVRDYIMAHGGSPSLREIGNGLDLKVVRVKHHIDRLVLQGELIRHPGPRGLRLPTMRDAALRLLREEGFVVDEDLMRVDRQRGGMGVTERELLPPPVLTYPERYGETGEKRG